MPALDLNATYCTADGQEPALWVDWAARLGAVRAETPPTYDGEGNEDDSAYESARQALGAERVALTSHIVRNGRGVRIAVGALLAAEVDLVGGVDAHGGALVEYLGEPVTCPECGERVRMIP
jgi:hypothetical protein